MFRPSALLRRLGRLALVLYLLAGALFLVVRHALLPHIDHWRPRIQAELSQALKTPVTLGRIEAGWKGWHPHFEFNDVHVLDDRGIEVLQLPRIRATLAWKGLFSGMPGFSYIEAVGLNIEARRDAQERIWILGRDIEVEQDGDSPQLALDHPMVQWLAKQPRIALRDAVLSWRDETRDGRVLRLQEVTLGVVSGSNGHRMALSAVPPGDLGRRFEMRADVNFVRPQLERTDPAAWKGSVYINVDGMTPLQWRSWMDIPGHMRSGDVSAQWWLTFAEAEPQRVAAHVKVEHGHWMLGDQAEVAGRHVEAFIDGSWPAYEGALEAFERLVMPSGQMESEYVPVRPSEDGPPVKFAFTVKGLDLNTPGLFEHVLHFGHVSMQGGVFRQAGGGLAALFDQSRVVNADMDLAWQGSWREGGDGAAGLADIQGLFDRATLDGIDLFMPTSVNLDAREWLTNGLLAGEIHNARVVLKGDLEHFPFGSSDGTFLIDGRFEGGIIDYAPGRTPDESWPSLHEVSGRAVLDRVDLQLSADTAIVRPAEGHSIQLRDINARIPNIEQNSVLTIQGQTLAPAPSYLALAHHSPLRRLLDGFLDPATAEGDWSVPLSLTIPLLNVDDTKVQGAVNFNGGTVSLDPDAPPFEQVEGRLEFSETGFSADGLKARFLGDVAEFSGGVGGGRKGLELKGRISADALRDYVGVQGMERLKGSLAYHASLRRQSSGRYAMTAQSDLQGLVIDLPEPAGKSADAKSRLDVQWVPAPAAGQMYLKVGLGSKLKAWFLRRESDKTGPYFVSGAVGTTLPDKLPAKGLVIDVRQSRLGVNAWESAVDEFGVPARSTAQAQVSPVRELFPELQWVRLQADTIELYGIELETATVTAQREQAQQWRFDIASTETAGTVRWREADAGSTGWVDAHFDRLAVGAEADKTQSSAEPGAQKAGGATEEASWEGEVDVPAVSLKVDNLRLYGRQVGALQVKGVSEQRGRFWRLNELSLASPSAALHGSGIWRLSGAERGLTLDAEVDIKDLGAFLDQIDVKDVMDKGHGTLKGRFEWRNMPWQYKRSDLNGQLRLELEKGRFSTVNSRTARLLELLSLQSIRRLATLSLDPASVFKGGFPFDRIAGTLHIQDGVMTTNDYQVTSPVATISIGGDVDLTSEKLDLQAMVVPKLDVSGATVAAGIAINPIVGLGAFVTQWLLSKPLSQAMTVHYDVDGDLNSPQLHEVSAPASKPAKVPPASHIEGGDVELDDDSANGLHDAAELKTAPAGKGLRAQR